MLKCVIATFVALLLADNKNKKRGE